MSGILMNVAVAPYAVSVYSKHNPVEYGSTEAAGFDLRAAESVTINPGTHALVKTGVHMQIPNGFVGDVRSRSGLAYKNGIFVLNSPGTIDSDYRGEVGVILANFGSKLFTARRGDRIAQMVIMPVIRVVGQRVPLEALTETERGSGGFGSTGTKGSVGHMVRIP